MADNVLEQRVVVVGEPAWHHKGLVLTTPVQATEAARLVGLEEVVIDKLPLMLDLGGIQVASGHFGLVRRPIPKDQQYRMLGVCGADYAYLQHQAMVEKLEELSKKWPVETIGVLGQGETVFVTLDAGQGEVKGDPVRLFFLVTDTKDGGRGINLHFTPVRVVCQNTLVMGEMAAIASANLRHTGKVEQSLDWHLGLVELMQDKASKVMDIFNVLADLTLTPEQVERVLKATYPLPRKPRELQATESLTPEEVGRLALAGLQSAMKDAERGWETTRLRLQERQASVKDKFAGSSPIGVTGELAGTGWALYNAVVEEEDYRKGTANEDQYVAALFGGRSQTKARAFAELVKVAERR